jgi:hypothetical protein
MNMGEQKENLSLYWHLGVLFVIISQKNKKRKAVEPKRNKEVQ